MFVHYEEAVWDPRVLATRVNQIDSYPDLSANPLDPPELASGVKEIAGCLALVASNLIHLPGKLAGVLGSCFATVAFNLLHRPDKLAGAELRDRCRAKTNIFAFKSGAGVVSCHGCLSLSHERLIPHAVCVGSFNPEPTATAGVTLAGHRRRRLGTGGCAV